MKDSRFNRLAVPVMTNFEAASNAQPAILCTAGRCPLRVVARNVGFGTSAFLTYDSAQSLLDIASGIGGNIYELPPGASDVFVLAPGQKIYVAAPAANAILSIAVSEALPTDIGDEKFID